MSSIAGRASQANAEPRDTRSSGAFKRTYKACEACRKTKAKCERDETSPSCLKCRREERECIFPVHRSTKRAKHAHTASSLSQGVSEAQSKRFEVLRLDHRERPPHENQEVPRSPATLLHQANPDPRQNGPNTLEENASGQNASDDFEQDPSPLNYPHGRISIHNATHTDGASLADQLQDQVVRTVVASSSDAVGLRFRAAGSPDSEGRDEIVNQAGIETGSAQSISTGILSPSLNTREHVPQEILDLWNQHRFVRQGWFTAREAVAYVDAFFAKLSPLSPVMDSLYPDAASHRQLILEEPLLSCTILMISSRYFHPAGPGGAVRADFIHTRVWRHIEHLVQRITFGSEKYSIAKSRTLGSIQALLMIIEWHPRSLHFPPENDGWDASLAPAVDDSFTPQERNTDASKRWREDVFEPAKRSDRLSWMLVGLATTLAHELGVFKPTDDLDSTGFVTEGSPKLRIRRLLYLYGTQLSLRLGCTNIFPQEALQDVTQTLSPPHSMIVQQYRDREMMLLKWIEITRLMTTVADMFFPSKSVTKQILRSARYVTLVNHFQPLLDAWHKGYTQMACQITEDSAHKILLVDYYYARMFIHSIAIQALVDRISSLSGGDEIWQDHEVWRSKYAQDFASVNEVRECSGKILMTAVELCDEGILQYCPVRLYLRIVSASVFLLKAISLGSREVDISSSLKTLDRCIAALQTNRADDIHLSSQYATLISRHVQRFRRNFRVKKTTVISAAMSPYWSRAPSPFRAGAINARGNRDLRQERQEQQPAISTSILSGLQQTPYAQSQGERHLSTEQFDFGDDGTMEDWWAQPFDPHIAPFGLDYMQAGAGIAVDSLDFLWNIPNQTGA